MRALILKIVDFAALALVVLATLAGLVGGLAVAFNDYAPPLARLAAPILAPVAGFVGGALVAGGIIALLEIVRNTRRTAEAVERLVKP